MRCSEFLRQQITQVLKFANWNSDYLTFKKSDFQKKNRLEFPESETELHFDGGPRNRNQKLELPTKPPKRLWFDLTHLV